MTPSGEVPASLISLATEAVEAIGAAEDITAFRATALFNTARDSIVQALPSFGAAKDAICEVPLVAERYGSSEQVGDRLTLQFVYQLFPRTDQRGIRQDVRRLWQRFLAELNIPVWVFLGVANLRNFTVDSGVRNPVQLSDGVSIRGRSFDVLRSLGFNEATLEAMTDDWSVGGSSQYVICVEHSQPKAPDNLILGDATGITRAQRALTCLRLVGSGDIMMGPMWFTRSGKFNVGRGGGVGRSGSQIPTVGGSAFVLTRRIVSTARTLQANVAHLEQHGYGGAPGNLDLALRAFESTYDRYPRRRDSQLVDTITAAEALLGSGTTELTFKLSFRAAGLLGRTTEERLRIFQAMKDFYDVRSKAVHGATMKAKQLQTLERVDDARDFVRRLLLAFVRLAASPSATYNRAFFNERLDAALQDDRARRLLLRALGPAGS